MNTFTATLGPLVSPDEIRLTGTDRQVAHSRNDARRHQAPAEAA